MHTVVVLAGGLGTRVAHLTGETTPKALLPIDGRAFMDFKLASLAAAGASEVVILVGHGAIELRTSIERTPCRGVTVSCIEDGPELLGTAGAIRAALDRLPPVFWVTHGDTLLDVPVDRVERLLDGDANVLAVMTVLANADQWETSNTDVVGDRVVAYEKGAPAGSHRYIDYGMMLFRREAFLGSHADLGDLLTDLVQQQRVGACEVDEPFHDIGNEAAWRATDAWCRTTHYWDRLMDEIGRRVS
jgi:MurNAc alpha-1-phosphate uridylyltransferase